MNNDLVCVAGICGDFGRTTREVKKVLDAEGIECFIEGSVVYGIEVVQKDKARAEKLLLKMQQEGWKIFFSDE